MSRPLPIDSLLAGIRKQKNAGNKQETNLESPKYLTKTQRERLLKDLKDTKDSKEPSSVQVKPILKNTRQPNEYKADLNKQHRNANKTLPFDHAPEDEQEDTFANYTPIVTSSKLKQLTSAARSKDDIELQYMGKHWTEKSLSEMTDRDWRILREDFHIHITNGNSKSVLNPLRNWEELDLIPKKLTNILQRDLKFDFPTPVQRITIPNIVKGNRDFVGVASTGSGKTLAFVLPMLTQLLTNGVPPIALKKMNGPIGLVLVPTRELAQQIQLEAEKVVNLIREEYPIKIESIVGGHSLEEISSNLNEGCDILIATPGKLIECLENHLLVISNLSYLVLDEADKMIDLGFEDQLKTILNNLEVNNSNVSSLYRTLMFTATLSSPLEKIASGYLRNPIYASINAEGADAMPQIQQVVQYCPTDDQKFKAIESILREKNTMDNPRVIIFINYKATADWLANKFASTKYKVTILHGSKSQEQREHSIQLLRSGKIQILIATNVAARGLDIPNVALVINFHFPKDFADYVHRIGRTGRAGNLGTAVTLIGDEEDRENIKQLYDYVMDNNPLKNNRFQKYVKDMYDIGKEKYDMIFY